MITIRHKVHGTPVFTTMSEHTTFRGSRIMNEMLDWADLRATDLTESDFSLSTFLCANLSYAFGEDAVMNGSNFTMAQMTGVSFTRSSFIQADFFKADLVRASFRNCNMSYARFDKADLSLSDFTKAKVFGADFRGCKLNGADFTGADGLYYAQFEN